MKKTKYAIIFDLDGTICDTLEDLANCNNRALEDYNLLPHTLNEYRYIVGNGIDKQIERAIGPEHYTKELALKVKGAFYSYYQKGYHNTTKSYDGMHKALQELKEMGFTLAVLSNKPDEFTQIICKEQYGDIFNLVRGHCKGAAVKPDPTVLKEMIHILNLQPSDCLYCGDTSVDMQTGARAGITTIAALWGFRPREELVENGAKILAELPSDLPGIAKTWLVKILPGKTTETESKIEKEGL